MKTLSIAAALLFAFGTVTFAQDASSTTKTSTSKTTTTKSVKKTSKTGGKKKAAVKPASTPASK